MAIRKMEFGGISGVEEGRSFENRREVFNAKLHRSLQAGISGRAEEGADAIVISGGYEDDHDKGDVIIYTGEGGRDPETRAQVASQELVKGNLALYNSMKLNLPVRVIRGATSTSKYVPSAGYRYDGIYKVMRAWQEKGKSGFLVWKFELCKQEDWKDV